MQQNLKIYYNKFIKGLIWLDLKKNHEKYLDYQLDFFYKVHVPLNRLIRSLNPQELKDWKELMDILKTFNATFKL